MTRKRVYLDSCVLMAAFKAQEPEISDAAIALIEDPDTDVLYSRITELEVMPKAVFHKKDSESAFYSAIFESGVLVPCTETIIDDALVVARCNGLSACDALHLACAVGATADEFVTSEKKTRLPDASVQGISIRTLR